MLTPDFCNPMASLWLVSHGTSKLPSDAEPPHGNEEPRDRGQPRSRGSFQDLQGKAEEPNRSSIDMPN